MKIIRSREFTAERAWGALDIANMGGITTRLHWTDQPYRWHVNDGAEVFAVLDGRSDQCRRVVMPPMLAMSSAPGARSAVNSRLRMIFMVMTPGGRSDLDACRAGGARLASRHEPGYPPAFEFENHVDDAR